MRLVKHKRVQEVVELNITAFLNLMVILVPFLLVTAVFSRMTILELNLPPNDAKVKQQQKVKLQLELVVRPQGFELRDATLGRLKYLSRDEGGTNWKIFGELLLEIKNRFPEEQGITLLLDSDVNYKTLIQVMDRVRSVDVVQVTDVETVELFPNISIGDAPELSVETESAPSADDPAKEGG